MKNEMSVTKKCKTNSTLDQILQKKSVNLKKQQQKLSEREKKR